MTPTAFILRYHCHVCGLSDRVCAVPGRGPELVTEWMLTVAEWVARDHRRARPTCPGIEFNLEIPLAGETQAVGTTRVQ